MEDERILAQWGDLVLTTERVTGPARAGGAAWLKVGEVQWAGVVRRGHDWLLWAALASWALPFVSMFALESVRADLADEGATVGSVAAVLVSAALVAIYLGTRSVCLVIGAGSGEVASLARGGSGHVDQAGAFVRAVFLTGGRR